jgi:hypothetical protein
MLEEPTMLGDKTTDAVNMLMMHQEIERCLLKERDGSVEMYELALSAWTYASDQVKHSLKTNKTSDILGYKELQEKATTVLETYIQWDDAADSDLDTVSDSSSDSDDDYLDMDSISSNEVEELCDVGGSFASLMGDNYCLHMETLRHHVKTLQLDYKRSLPLVVLTPDTNAQDNISSSASDEDESDEEEDGAPKAHESFTSGALHAAHRDRKLRKYNPNGKAKTSQLVTKSMFGSFGNFKNLGLKTSRDKETYILVNGDLICREQRTGRMQQQTRTSTGRSPHLKWQGACGNGGDYTARSLSTCRLLLDLLFYCKCQVHL